MFDKLKKLADQAKEKATPMVGQAAQKAAELAAEAKEKAGPLAEQAKERATELAAKAAPAVSQGVDKAAGSLVKPRSVARGVTGSDTPMPTMRSVVIVSDRLGRLRNGLPIVRMTKSTSVCVASDSTNQPV